MTCLRLFVGLRSTPHPQRPYKALLYRYSFRYHSHIRQLQLDAYVIDTLMPDLVLHDRQPSAFLVYLQLWYRSASRKDGTATSYRELADATGLSKSAVQTAVRRLARRQLIRVTRESVTAVPRYTVLRPWRK